MFAVSPGDVITPWFREEEILLIAPAGHNEELVRQNQKKHIYIICLRGAHWGSLWKVQVRKSTINVSINQSGSVGGAPSPLPMSPTHHQPPLTTWGEKWELFAHYREQEKVSYIIIATQLRGVKNCLVCSMENKRRSQVNTEVVV